MTDWYSVSRQKVDELGGGGLLRRKGSLHGLLSAVYPSVEWDPTRFKTDVTRKERPTLPHRNKTYLLKSLERIEEQFGIQKPDDWYAVRLTDLEELGFPKRIGTARLAELLKEKYPDQRWDKIHLLRGRFALQRRLERAVAALFPGLEIKTNVKKEAGVLNPDTGYLMEIDVFVPSLHLALEFQEKHHYVGVETFSDRPLETIQSRDAAKREAARQKGLTLIAVPCWWDYKVESLAATIRKVRPDLAERMHSVAMGDPIAETPPSDFFQKDQGSHIEDIGEPINPCFFVNNSIDPTNWWMFEKYDGVRGFWNPIKKAFYSRKGNQFILFPQEIVDSMPDVFLDGELWFGRHSYQEATKINCRTDLSQVNWDKFQYMVFDIPTLRGSYKVRYDELVNAVEHSKCKYLSLAKYEECKDMQHLEQFFQDVLDKGGEGIILRDPNSLYKPGRSQGYLKHKKFRDAEAKIVSTLGPLSWECELPSGVRFTASAGSSEFVKRWTPQAGDIVSFKHHGFLHTSQKPKLPSIHRLRNDLSWADVVLNWRQQTVAPQAPPLVRKRKWQPTLG